MEARGGKQVDGALYYVQDHACDIKADVLNQDRVRTQSYLIGSHVRIEVHGDINAKECVIPSSPDLADQCNYKEDLGSQMFGTAHGVELEMPLT